jgi:hypothetical protein
VCVRFWLLVLRAGLPYGIYGIYLAGMSYGPMRTLLYFTHLHTVFSFHEFSNKKKATVQSVTMHGAEAAFNSSKEGTVGRNYFGNSQSCECRVYSRLHPSSTIGNSQFYFRRRRGNCFGNSQ